MFSHVINLNKVVERQFSVVRNAGLMTAKTVIFLEEGEKLSVVQFCLTTISRESN